MTTLGIQNMSEPSTEVQEESNREMAISLQVFDSEAINVLIGLPAVDNRTQKHSRS